MKKISKLWLMGIMLSAFMTGCSAASGGSAAESSTTAAVETTAAAEESQAATDVADGGQEAVKDTADENSDGADDTTAETDADGAFLTVGTYEGDSDFVDEDQALFTDEYGIEFVAQLSDDTKLPEGGLVKGQTYVVAHSEMMTASLPGIYPEVYSITEKS